MKLDRICKLGRDLSYIRLACKLQKGWAVKCEGEGYILGALNDVKKILNNNNLNKKTITEIDTWINKFENYKDGAGITKDDADKLYDDFNRWWDRLELELSNISVLRLYTCGSLNFDLLKNGSKEFFTDEVWNKLPKISKNDLDESAKCIICQIPTASAMISLRATEDVLREYYKYKTKQKVGKKGWKNIIDELLSEDSPGNLKYKVNKSLMGHLDYIRDNKRNVAEHPDKIFSQREAEGIFFQVVNTIIEIYGDMQ